MPDVPWVQTAATSASVHGRLFRTGGVVTGANMVGESLSPDSPEALTERLNEFAQRGSAARWALQKKLKATAVLLGESVGHAFEPEVVAMFEGYDEAVDAGRRAITTLKADRDFLVERNDRLRAQLTVAAIDTRARFKRARKPEPDWVADAFGEGEPF